MQDASYFKALSNPQLDFAIKDIVEARDIVGKCNPDAELKYSDQLSYALAERNKRQGKDCCPTCKRPL